MKMTSQEFYFKTPEEMRKAFHYIPEACDNTLKIADQCNVELNWEDENGNQIYHLPDFPIDTGETMDEFFARMSREGLEERFKEGLTSLKLSKKKTGSLNLSLNTLPD